MIFYFSGSGNSYYVASTVAEKLNSELVSIAECLKTNNTNFDIRKDEYCGFVFPIHFWGIPYIVTEFINNIHIKLDNDTYIFVIYTCGGATGKATNLLKQTLNKHNITLTSTFSVKQIDIFVPIFRIPSKNKQDEIILHSQNKINSIIDHITLKNAGDFDDNKGFLPYLSTKFLYPLYSYYRNTAKFRVSDICTACKKCESICPLNIIEIKNNKPIWKNKKCTLCFSCLHICPIQAINYGKILFLFDSKNKGRYRHPLIPKKY